jgi:hypothetical protein
MDTIRKQQNVSALVSYHVRDNGLDTIKNHFKITFLFD